MANLIIKPTSGGSLILQDEGGDAALTVGTTGSTTLAGTANNIGTVTAGTLGSAVVPPANYIFKAYKTSSQTYTSAQFALVTWDADAHSSWNSGTSKGFDLTNNYYVTPATGTYHVGIAGRMTDSTSGGWVMVLTKNETPSSVGASTAANQGISMVTEFQSTYINSNSKSSVMSLTAGDILRVYVSQNMDGSEDLQAASDGSYQTYFYGYKIF